MYTYKTTEDVTIKIHGVPVLLKSGSIFETGTNLLKVDDIDPEHFVQLIDTHWILLSILKQEVL